MGIVEYDNDRLIVFSHILTYGNAATAGITEQIRDEIETMWNEPQAAVKLNNKTCPVIFKISASFHPNIQPIEVYENLDPKNNYLRVEEFAHGNISFVDGLGCNSGYFKLENLYKGSTTAAHEYGHTLGLDHPRYLDIRGEGVPGIMYPRGTLVDAPFQYDPSKPVGVTGGTMHPIHRKVRQADVEHLNFHKLEFTNRTAILGEFTNVYHWDHAQIPPEQFMRPPIYG